MNVSYLHLIPFILHFIAQHSTPLPATGPQGARGHCMHLCPPTSVRPAFKFLHTFHIYGPFVKKVRLRFLISGILAEIWNKT